MVFGIYFQLPNWTIIGIILSIVFGYANYQTIERIRFNKINKTTDFFKAKVIYISVFVFVLSGLCYVGVKVALSKVPNQKQYLLVGKGRTPNTCFTPSGSQSNKGSLDLLNCTIGSKKESSRIVSFGDSFMGQYEPLLKDISDDLGISIRSLTSGSCFPSFSRNDHSPDGNERRAQCIMNRDYLKNNINNFDVVIISIRWDEYYKDLNDYSEETFNFIKQLTKQKKHVIFFPVPTIYQKNLSSRIIASIALDKPFDIKPFKLDKKKDDYNKLKSKELKERFENNRYFTYIDKKSFYPEETFLLNGKTYPYSADGAHISQLGSHMIFNKIYNTKLYQDKLKSLLQ
jgi:hypothetical protein